MVTACQHKPDQRLSLGASAAHILFPLHITLGPDGRVTGAGRTITRMFGPGLIGRPFFSVFTVEKPRLVDSWDRLLRKTGTKLRIKARPGVGEHIEMHAVSAPFGSGDRGLIIDFSFGPNISAAISRFDLTGQDFRPNDYSIDLVYTFETQRSLLEDSKRLAEALHEAKEEAERKAHLDPVTGIANRRAVLTRLDMLLARNDTTQTHALLHLDLDKFKPINDTFGHLTGDEVLRQISRILGETGGTEALPARIGGDEFVLLLPGIKDPKRLDEQIRDLISDICAPLRIGSHSFRVGVSIGVVLFKSADFPTPDKLLQHSDIALYEAKKVGGTFAHITAAMLQKRDDAATLVEDIEIGLERGEFVPHFQLQLDGVSNRIHGVEVLARWERPGRPTLAPGGFLRAATRADLMGQIDESVRARAISTFAAWRRMGIEPGGISINISPANLRSTDFCETIQDEVFAAGLHPQSIRLELLESILFERADTYLIEQSQRLHDAGFALILDDFGTGHASIATLVDVPVSMIKIDQSFVMGIDTAPKKRRVVGSMLAMAESLGLRVMAEGVETLAEMNILKNAGCRYFQGYYVARPMAAKDVAELLANWNRPSENAQSAG